ncbi:aminotransferase class I/II-fold pyridoxal phosphate-dependent enzyme [Alloacidobacterium dinghuense]|uniref:Aminotransferase class I/II-fold pyridoxal phosphate-dependent enzyme n=1 Tax=Alloacidobacterium dinghuense TaxID=2763107 RepID=A0A7G8BET7_9BACT|nr:aminotransferase class I/II-fold pyridoxal phosphate-dependent enzyme [Alloacidobacterium dinghuense]QNI31057.1 aminotransferase class I/II-fold pyridoxal phosphate-dependent enzyme [Alloacidobacterium dinghuense]
MVTKKATLRVAKRLDEVGFSDIVQIRNKVMELRSAGQLVHAFHGGEPFFETPEPIKYAMIRAMVENKTKYAPSSGIMPLREALVEKLRTRNHLDVALDDVLITSGGAHALYVAFQAVLDPGDDMLLFSPYWTPIRDMVTAAQARPLLVPTASARRNGLTKALEQFSTPHTKAIYYNTPQNPSGAVFSREEAEEVASFARKHNLIVIADEAYEDLVYEGEHVSIASLPGMAERTISTFTFSKSYGMTGWRVGYLVAKEPFITGLRKLVLYSANGVSTPSQWAALEALATTQSFIDRRREEYRERRDLLVNALNELGLECEMPQGAFYALPSVCKIHKDSRKAATILLEKAHVATIPGVVFGAQGEGCVRFGYSVPMAAIEAGIEALSKFLK